MTLFDFSTLTGYLIIVTGLFVLMKGDWRPHRLKFAAIVLSTVSGIFIFLNKSIAPPAPVCDPNDLWCLSLGCYIIARNAAIILFHIAVGRDSIILRNRDRRTACSDLATKT